MPRIAVFGGTGYLASLIKNQNNIKKNQYIFFSRKKNSKNYINYSTLNKNLDNFKNFDFVIHLAGPNQKQFKKNENLIKKKNQITSIICDLCILYDIKLIYISSLQVYKNYGKDNLSIYSIIDLKNLYSKSHWESEKIIKTKFLNHKGMFTILRIGNVFGFKKYEKLKKIKNNLVHDLSILALKKKRIVINNGSIQRTYIPSQIFVETINSVIKKNFFKNSILNIVYKNFRLKSIAQIIQKRCKLVLNLKIDIEIKKFIKKNLFRIYSNQNFKFYPKSKIFLFEIDKILKNLNKYLN
jgi:nucleoside-diphosphate-sugar epimerase